MFGTRAPFYTAFTRRPPAKIVINVGVTRLRLMLVLFKSCADILGSQIVIIWMWYFFLTEDFIVPFGGDGVWFDHRSLVERRISNKGSCVILV